MAAQLLVGRGPGGGDGGADAAGVVAAPGHPGRELRGPVAGEDQVAWRVDEARGHGAAADVDRCVGRRRVPRRARPRRRAPSSTTSAASATAPSGPSPRRVVGDQLADAGDQRCVIASPTARSIDVGQ